MKLQEWWPWYRNIAALLGYSRKKDQQATDLLSRLLEHKSISRRRLHSLLRARSVIIYGGGPSLATDLRGLAKFELTRRCLNLAVDGATSALLQLCRLTPHLIVTDLDGHMSDIVRAHQQGSLVIVHAHGDNITQLQVHTPKFTAAFGTTQVEPRRNVHNLGGFTDGDRAAILADSFGARRIILAGMDFGQKIGRFSKVKVRSPEVKLLKLRIGKLILEHMATRSKAELWNITSRGEEIAGFNQTTPSKLAIAIRD